MFKEVGTGTETDLKWENIYLVVQITSSRQSMLLEASLKDNYLSVIFV